MTTYVFGGNANPAYDTFVWASEPSKPHNGLTYAVLGDGTAAYQWGSALGALPKDPTIASAILTVYSWHDYGGARTMSAFLAAADWTAHDSTWNNRPGTTGPGVDVTHVVGQLGVPFSFDVTDILQAAVAAGDFPGFVVKFTDGGDERRIFTRNGVPAYQPTLVVEATAPGQRPSRLSPNGYVGDPKPMLSGFPKGTQAVRVQADPLETGFGAPTWESGTQSVNAPQFNLGTSTFPGSSEGDTWWWRVSTKDQGGNWSDYADPVHFTYEPLPVFEITGPSASVPFVTDPSPTFTRSDPDPFYTITSERVYVTLDGDKRQDAIWDTGRLFGADISNSHTMPGGKLKTRDLYKVWWQITDQFDRVATAGFPPYAGAAQTFSFADVPGVPPVSALTATQVGGSPLIRVHWERDAGSPDQFTLWRDDEILLHSMDPADYFDDQEDGWAFVDGTANPQTRHDYYVQAVVNGSSSVPGPHAVITTKVGADWLIVAPDDLSVMLVNANSTTFQTQDQIIVVRPAGAKAPRAFQTEVGWRTGEISGLIMDLPGGRTLEEWEADWDALRDVSLSAGIFWASGNKMFAVILWNMQAAREPNLPRTLRLTAQYAQVGKDRVEGSPPPPPGGPTVPPPDVIYRYADLGLGDGDPLTVGPFDITAVTGTPTGSDDAIVPGHIDTEGWS